MPLKCFSTSTQLRLTLVLLIQIIGLATNGWMNVNKHLITKLTRAEKVVREKKAKTTRQDGYCSCVYRKAGANRHTTIVPPQMAEPLRNGNENSVIVRISRDEPLVYSIAAGAGE